MKNVLAVAHCCQWNSKDDYYRPHSKNGEGTVFTGVCPSTPGVGVRQGYRRGYLSPKKGVSLFGYPLARSGVPSPPPPARTGLGCPPGQNRTWYPSSPRQYSRGYSCYAMGGMPLVFTQDDFLVVIRLFTIHISVRLSNRSKITQNKINFV